MCGLRSGGAERLSAFRPGEKRRGKLQSALELSSGVPARLTDGHQADSYKLIMKSDGTHPRERSEQKK